MSRDAIWLDEVKSGVCGTGEDTTVYTVVFFLSLASKAKGLNQMAEKSDSRVTLEVLSSPRTCDGENRTSRRCLRFPWRSIRG